MNSDSTSTNFNMQKIKYHATCIKIDIAWKIFGRACNNFSTSPGAYNVYPRGGKY